jgi:uncharacterized protein (DUF2147 family)
MIKPITTVMLIIVSLAPAAAQAQSAQNLDGIWRSQDGSSTVRVAKCPQSSNWCANVIDEKLKPGETSSLNQMVVREMRPNGKKGWTGQYVVDGQSYKASAKLQRQGVLAVKICALAFLCETTRLEQIGR